MKKIGLLVITIVVLINSEDCLGQDSLWQQTYDYSIYNNFDLRNSSRNFISTYRVVNDGFDAIVNANMKPKAANISKAIFTFGTAYLTMLWSHEIGHSLRAKQVGGKFNIHNFALPVPYTTVDLPEDISLTDEALFSATGFEVNYLNVRTFKYVAININLKEKYLNKHSYICTRTCTYNIKLC